MQPIPRDLKDNGVAAMLVVLRKGDNENPFVYENQHGGDDVTCKPRFETVIVSVQLGVQMVSGEMMSRYKPAMD